LKWRQLALRYWELVNKNELMALGGQVTYYLILSFFPLLIFFLTLAGYADVSSEKVFEDLKYILPQEISSLVESIIYEIFSTHSPTLLSFGMLGAFWASMNGINALLRGMSKAYGLREKRSFVRLLLISAVALIIITITIIISLLIQFYGETLGNFILSKLSLLILLLFLVLVFILLNRMSTNSKYTSRMVLPGSLFSALGWIIISLGFTIYFKHFNNFSLTYGSLGGIMVLLLWLYWSCEILLLGCALNAVLINYNLEKSKVAK